MKRKKLKLIDITKGSILAALSAGISLFFAYAVPLGGSIGLPLYALPLIVASITLGPGLGLVVAFIADLGIGFLGPYGYKILYAFSTLFWGLVPGFIIRGEKRYSLLKLVVAIFYSYLLATLANSFANYIYWGKKTFFATLPIRVFNMLCFIPVLSWVAHIVLTNVFVKKTKYLCGVKMTIAYEEKN